VFWLLCWSGSLDISYGMSFSDQWMGVDWSLSVHCRCWWSRYWCERLMTLAIWPVQWVRVCVCVCGHNGDCFECCVRCKVYKILASVGIDKPRYTAVNRDSPTEGSVCFPDFLVCWVTNKLTNTAWNSVDELLLMSQTHSDAVWTRTWC